MKLRSLTSYCAAGFLTGRGPEVGDPWSSELDRPGPCPHGASIPAGEVRWGRAAKNVKQGGEMEGAWAEGGAALDSVSGRGYLGWDLSDGSGECRSLGEAGVSGPRGREWSKRWVLREEFRPRCGSL